MITPTKVKADHAPMVSMHIKDGITTYKVLIRDDKGSHFDLELTEQQYQILKRY